MDAGNRAHLEPRRIHRHDEATDPAFALAADAREQEHDIGARGVAGPDLRSVHHIAVVVGFGARLHIAEVGARLGLRKALAPQQFARSDRPQVAPLLCLGSEFHDRRSEEHTSELQSLMRNSYAAICWKKKIM